MSRGITLLKWSPLVIFGVALSVFLILFIRYQRKPDILEISRLAAAAGDRIEVSGRYFGGEADGGKLIVGERSLSSTGIIEWSDQRIVARVPRSDGAVLVKVETRSGVSNGVVLGDAMRFPRVEYGSWLPGAPFVEYIEPDRGGPGTLVTLRGKGFGPRKTGGGVWVNSGDSTTLLGRDRPDLRLYIEAPFIDLWTDSEIRFWLPTGVNSGNIYVEKGEQFSNPVPFEALPGPGSITVGKTIRWSLRQDLIFNRIGALPGNSLYLRVPVPAAGTGQSPAVMLDDGDTPLREYLRRDGNLDIYRMDELTSGENRTISRQIVVDTAAVSFSVDPAELLPYDPGHPELAAALAIDPWIRPDLVPRTSAREIGNLRDDWRKARALYDYVINLLTWSDEPPTRIIPEYISTELADSEGYSFLFCSLARAAEVPARPVGGLLVDDNGESRLWWWAEFWIEGLGWVPVDPALGDNGSEENRRDFYFGSLEGRHIAFSRGILESRAMQPDTELRETADRYSLQGVWEEVSGNLYSYQSSWPVPRITAVYE